MVASATHVVIAGGKLGCVYITARVGSAALPSFAYTAVLSNHSFSAVICGLNGRIREVQLGLTRQIS